VKVNLSSTPFGRASMQRTISARTLRAELGEILERVRRGERFTVLYRSRPVCRLVPLEGADDRSGALEDDPIFRSGPLGRSSDGLSSEDHDGVLYGSGR
jgi:prevent-host-death family protein